MTIPEPLVILAIVGAAGALGGLVLLLRGRRLALDPLEFPFAAVGVGILLLGWLALILAELGRFSIGLLVGLWMALTLGLVGLVLKRQPAPRRLRPALLPATSRWEVGALVVWAVAAGVLFFRPHQFVIGGADAGVYVNLGANIARTGGILIHDPVLADLDPALYPALLRAMPPGEAAPYYLLPGFYVPGTPRGLVVPQFYALSPTWQAVAYALGGVQAELLMTPLWALLGCLAVYFTVRRLWGWKAGLLALAALSVTGLQIWFARYPTAEMLTQYLFWMGAWALIAWADKQPPRGLWAGLAGTALGQVLLARIDLYVLLAVPLFWGLWLLWKRDLRRLDGWFFGPFTLLTIHSVVHGIVISNPYFTLLLRYESGLLGRGVPIALAGFLLVGLVLFALPGDRRTSLALWVRRRRLGFAWGAAAVLIVLAAFAYFVRPAVGQTTRLMYWYGGGEMPDLDHLNFLRLGWYLSPLGLALGVGGMAWMLIRGADRRTAFVLASGLFVSVFYLWRIQANPHQVYAMRRYVPVVVPFFIISAVFLVNWLWTRPKGKIRWLAIGLTLVWFSGILASARGLVSQVDYRGILGQLDQLNAGIKPNSVLIFNDPAPVGAGDFLGTPLHFLYGHDVFTLRNAGELDPVRFEEAILKWQALGRTVYWVSVSGGPAFPGRTLTLGDPRRYQVIAKVLEATYDHRPRELTDVGWQVSVESISVR